jgi:BR serine/threonine kinase
MGVVNFEGHQESSQFLRQSSCQSADSDPFSRANTQGYLPFDDTNIRNLLNKVKQGFYVMPGFSQPCKDLISRMLCLSPSSRITLAQIKAHPAFRQFLPTEYVCPSPLPVPSFQTPIPLESVPAEVLDLLHRIGYRDDAELAADLLAPSHTMAKVFKHMVTTQIEIEQLQWDESLTGRLDGDGFIMVDPSDRSFSIMGDDLFHRHGRSQSGQSVGDPASVASAAEWAMGDAKSLVFEQVHNVVYEGVTLAQAMFSVQRLMVQLEMQWFHPDDETVICRQHHLRLYVVVQGKENASGPCATTMQLQLCSGPPEAFSVLVHSFEETMAHLT